MAVRLGGGAVRRLIFLNVPPFRLAGARLGSADTHAVPPPTRAELPIIQAAIDLIRWYVPLLNRLPRDHRFGLGDRMVSGLYELLEGLVSARYSRTKLPLLEPLPARLDLLQIQTRLLQDFKLIDIGRYEHASRLLDGVGRQLTGWLGQQRQSL